MDAGPFRVAIAHDYLTQRGGAERVLLSILRAFPTAPLYTSLYDPHSTFAEFQEFDVRPLWTDRVPGLRRKHRIGFPLYPLAFSRRRIDADVVICSSSGFAHGIRTSGRKLTYCYTPARWLYEEADRYLEGWPRSVRFLLRTVAPLLRRWDRRAACSADITLTTSSAVRDRIARTYAIPATILSPPVHVTNGPDESIDGVEPGFLLSVGRLLTYKNVNIAIDAMAALPDQRLLVVGDGPERWRLQALAGPNVMFGGEVTESELRWAYRNCLGLISPSFEDYGLTPIEAAAHGRPAVVLRRGGFLDTVLDGETGVFVDELTPAGFAEGVQRLITHQWNTDTLVAHADAHGVEAFVSHLRDIVIMLAAQQLEGPH